MATIALRGKAGLGSNHIIEMHGGRIWVESDVDKCSVVSLSVPVIAKKRGPTMSKCILVVEDQPDNRQILRDLLGNAGYELVEAENGVEALTAVAKKRPDLILMDIQLPILDGYETTRRIRSNSDLQSLPIIAVTSYALAGDDAKALAAGCNGYVTKPYSPRQLLAKIREYLG